MNPFVDKIAIVTGGASGIGQALAVGLGQGGALVIVADMNRKGAQQVAATITAKGGRAHAVYVNVSKSAQVEHLIHDSAKKYGGLHYLFNNAGIAVMGEVLDMKRAHWQHTLDVNLWGVIHGTAAAYPVMVEQGFGHIINIASAAGLVPVPLLTAYTATKHAVVGLSLALRVEAAERGVKVSVVCPGIIRTNIPNVATYLKVKREVALSQLPSIRTMDPDKCARVILRSVAHNKGIIKVTPFAYIISWLYRIHPALMNPWYRKALKEFQILKSKS
ncbi:MAG: SDR family NAD(P)-dependent oxidoreductase [Deltaproteobacteria bacterium]|nr:SDR family NAD(P)-dependent oxidoreductase [Deltaproteobacteria bacterium]